MQVRSVAKYVRLSPQKGRLVADQIRSLPVEKALEVLEFSPKKGSVPMKKVLDSAIATASRSGSNFTTGTAAPAAAVEVSRRTAIGMKLRIPRG